MTAFLLGFLIGVLSLIGYGVYRSTNSDGWDDSNALNFLRLLSHVYIHPEDFGKMYYLNEQQLKLLRENKITRLYRPFWYIEADEFETVVDSRPFDEEK